MLLARCVVDDRSPGLGAFRVVSFDCSPAFALAPAAADTFTIGELVQEFGITARALRFYEEEELIAPRRDGATRIYSRRDRVRVALILAGKSVGFSLDDIGEMLDLYDPADGGAAQRKAAAEHCRSRAETLHKQLAEVQATIETLSQMAAGLERAG